MPTKCDINFEAVLVSRGWNKNHHYFSRKSLAKSFPTAIDTPINKDHNSTEVIGTIKDAYPVTDVRTKELIEDRVDHILVDAIVWHSMLVERYGEVTADIISHEIVGGAWGVSMECQPQDIDFIVQFEGNTFLLPLTDETAWLIFHTPPFGGDGYIAGYRIGLYLKDIEFIGMGITKNPANTNSKILRVGNQKIAANMENIKMEDKEKIEGLSQELEIAKAKEAEMSDQIDGLEATLGEAQAELMTIKNDLEQHIAEIESQVAEKDQSIVDLTSQVKEQDEKIVKVDALNEKVASLEESILIRDRRDALAKLGSEMSDEQLKAFSDESFKITLDVLTKKGEIELVVEESKETSEVVEATTEVAEEAVVVKDTEEKKEVKPEFEEVASEGLPATTETSDEEFGRRVSRSLTIERN